MHLSPPSCVVTAQVPASQGPCLGALASNGAQQENVEGVDLDSVVAVPQASLEEDGRRSTSGIRFAPSRRDDRQRGEETTSERRHSCRSYLYLRILSPPSQCNASASSSCATRSAPKRRCAGGPLTNTAFTSTPDRPGFCQEGRTWRQGTGNLTLTLNTGRVLH